MATCKFCNGEGRVQVESGGHWDPSLVECGFCDGTGERAEPQTGSDVAGFVLAFFGVLAACGDNTAPVPTVDASAPDSSTLDAYDPYGDPPTELCADLCPNEELTPWYNPANTYVWSYCRPSYRRCIDPTAPVCQGCP